MAKIRRFELMNSGKAEEEAAAVVTPAKDWYMAEQAIYANGGRFIT